MARLSPNRAARADDGDSRLRSSPAMFPPPTQSARESLHSLTGDRASRILRRELAGAGEAVDETALDVWPFDNPARADPDLPFSTRKRKPQTLISSHLSMGVTACEISPSSTVVAALLGSSEFFPKPFILRPPVRCPYSLVLRSPAPLRLSLNPPPQTTVPDRAPREFSRPLHPHWCRRSSTSTRLLMTEESKAP